jgi:hypothetical protein
MESLKRLRVIFHPKWMWEGDYILALMQYPRLEILTLEGRGHDPQSHCPVSFLSGRSKSLEELRIRRLDCHQILPVVAPILRRLVLEDCSSSRVDGDVIEFPRLDLLHVIAIPGHDFAFLRPPESAVIKYVSSSSTV